MSKRCKEVVAVTVTGDEKSVKAKRICDRPAMARWNDRWVCYTCLNTLEDNVKQPTKTAARR